ARPAPAPPPASARAIALFVRIHSAGGRRRLVIERRRNLLNFRRECFGLGHRLILDAGRCWLARPRFFRRPRLPRARRFLHGGWGRPHPARRGGRGGRRGAGTVRGGAGEGAAPALSGGKSSNSCNSRQRSFSSCPGALMIRTLLSAANLSPTLKTLLD